VSIKKDKLRYIGFGIDGTKGLVNSTKVNSSTKFIMAPYPTHIDGLEHLVILTPETGSEVHSESSFSFYLSSVVKAPELEKYATEISLKLKNSKDTNVLVSSNNDNEPISNTEDEIYDKMARLETIIGSGLSGTSTEVKVLDKIVDVIKADDSVVDIILDRLLRNVNSNNLKLDTALVGMLGAAGTPKAQQALMGIVESTSWPLERRETALFSFAQVTEPIPEVDSKLRSLHEKNDVLSNSSLLVLAAIGDRVKEYDLDRFNKIVDYVLSAANNPDINERIVGLEAIGNLNLDKLPEIVLTSLKSDDPLIREKSVAVLGRSKDKSAGMIIQNILKNDSSEGVRVVAANILSDTSFTNSFESLSYAVINDASEHVRMAATTSLGQWMSINKQGVSSILQQVANQDQSIDVKDAAVSILTRE
jgi:HEAT repeat protein